MTNKETVLSEVIIKDLIENGYLSTCNQCHSYFVPKRIDNVYCSRACKDKRYYESVR